MIDIEKKFKQVCKRRGYEELTRPVMYEGYDFGTHLAGWSDISTPIPLLFQYKGIQTTFSSLVNKNYFSFVMILLVGFVKEFNLHEAYPFLEECASAKGYDLGYFNVWGPNTKYFFPVDLDETDEKECLLAKIELLKRRLCLEARYRKAPVLQDFPRAEFLRLAADFLHMNFTEFEPKIVKRRVLGFA